jgi:hypothetical protein
MRELAEVLLRGANTLTRGQREMIATLVSDRNNCRFVRSDATAHGQRGIYRPQRVARSLPPSGGTLNSPYLCLRNRPKLTGSLETVARRKLLELVVCL